MNDRFRFDRFEGGEPPRKKRVIDSVSEAIASLLPEFLYYKTYQHFRGEFEGGTSYIGLEHARHIFALRFGVYHNATEQIAEQFFGAQPGPRYFPKTISKYSYNMGPTSPHWSYKLEVTWPLYSAESLALAIEEIKDFVSDAVLPYVLRHRDPLAVRDTLLNAPGLSDHWRPTDITLFAIDWLMQRRDWLEEDYQSMRIRFARSPSDAFSDFENRYKDVVSRWKEKRP